MYFATVFASTNLLDKLFYLLHLFKGFICSTQSRVNYQHLCNENWSLSRNVLFHSFSPSIKLTTKASGVFIATEATVVNIGLATIL